MRPARGPRRRARSEIAAAEARREEAETTLARMQALADSGTSSKAALERAKRDATIAAETQTALRHRLGGVEVELTALRKGVFIGDNYNDRPRSAQRADEIGQRLSEVDRRHPRSRSAPRHAARRACRREASAMPSGPRPTLVAPVRGSVWEI